MQQCAVGHGACTSPATDASLRDDWLAQMVAVFLQPPDQLFKPAILREVLPYLMSAKWKSMSDVSRLFLMAIGVILPLMISAAVIKAF